MKNLSYAMYKKNFAQVKKEFEFVPQGIKSIVANTEGTRENAKNSQHFLLDEHHLGANKCISSLTLFISRFRLFGNYVELIIHIIHVFTEI